MQEGHEYVEVYVQFNCTTNFWYNDRVFILYCPLFFSTRVGFQRLLHAFNGSMHTCLQIVKFSA